MEESGGTHQDISGTVKSTTIEPGGYAPLAWCIVTTIVAIPIWFLAMASAIGPPDNPFALIIYFSLCLILAIPVAVFNGMAIAPLVARPLRLTPTYIRGFLLNALFLLAGCLLIVGGMGGLLLSSVLFAGTIVSRTLAWTLVVWYLAMLLLPPMVAGSLAYSWRIVASCRRGETK